MGRVSFYIMHYLNTNNAFYTRIPFVDCIYGHNRSFLFLARITRRRAPKVPYNQVTCESRARKGEFAVK